MATRTGKAILWYACALQAFWGIGLLVAPHAVKPTPLGPAVYLMPHRLAAAMFLVATSLAVYALRHRLTPIRDVMLLLPQQSLLVLSAVGSLNAILSRSYADGVRRPFWFIAIDQSPSVLLAAWHAWAVLVQSGTLA